ncbi:MAG: integration host factor subunit beta [Deltaproteobacteria bacterium]|nr:integration host factor subunit beta [Deltaproteobacteria bacterium]
MTKSDLIAKVAEHIPGSRKRDAEVIVNTIFDRMVEALAQGDRIEIRGFGSFHLRQRDSRIGRDPKTGAKVEVASKKVPFFKAGKELRQRVDGIEEDPSSTPSAPSTPETPSGDFGSSE